MADEAEATPQALSVTVLIEWADGSEDEHQFFLRDDEPFPLIIEQLSGFPKAEHGPMSFTLPRWPSFTSHKPPPASPVGRTESGEG